MKSHCALSIPINRDRLSGAPDQFLCTSKANKIFFHGTFDILAIAMKKGIFDPPGKNNYKH